MNRNLFTLYTTIVLFLPAFLHAQVSNHQRITAEERRALEKQFEELKTFYIDDDGLVVYQQKEDTSTTSDKQNTTQSQERDRVKVKVSVDDNGDYIVTTEETIDTSFIQSGVPTEAAVLQNKGSLEDSYQKQAEEAGRAANGEKKEVFRKRESSYKSLEEAALAVDALLEELKREQSQQPGRGRGSLSQKLTRGVDGSLRENTYEFSNSNKDITAENGDNENGDENPTYYINGVISTKEDVDKLKTKDILKKSIKRSKHNPNGEWWIETRQK